jgi:hypothetical protein
MPKVAVTSVTEAGAAAAMSTADGLEDPLLPTALLAVTVKV